MKQKLLYIVRSEADFERAVALALHGAKDYDQLMIFSGDRFPFYNGGICNKVQRSLLERSGVPIRDFCSYSVIGRFLRFFSLKEQLEPNDVFFTHKSLSVFLKFIFLYCLKTFLRFNQESLVKKILKKEKPQALLMDVATEKEKYIPDIFRTRCIKMKIPVLCYTHGAGGGLHGGLHPSLGEDAFRYYYLFVCGKKDMVIQNRGDNRIVLGDFRSSYKYQVDLINENLDDIDFLNDRPHRISFFQGGVFQHFTCTNGWSTMEEMMINLSERDDVAIIIKAHPRERNICDFRMLERFKNLKIVGSDVCRSRVVKWSTVCVCSEYCSTIFEPMIMERKVVAVRGIRIPSLKDAQPVLLGSSASILNKAEDFDLDVLTKADSNDPYINDYCWGGLGKKDLIAEFFKHTDSILKTGRTCSHNLSEKTLDANQSVLRGDFSSSTQ